MLHREYGGNIQTKRKQPMSITRSKLVASELLLEAVKRHNIHLSLLVADTGLWVNPEFHNRLVRDTSSAAIYPDVRRARGQGEKRGQIVDGVRLDDNTYANGAMKRAAGLGKSAEGFEVCHIWPRTCYDARYHTAVANIVLLPRALAGLSDHDIEIQTALQYRAFELYGWYPEGRKPPVKPEFYPSKWREPQPDTINARTPHTVSASSRSVSEKRSPEKRLGLTVRIADWSRKPDLKVHKIIGLVAQAHDGISRDELVMQVANVTQSKNPYGAVASLLTDSGNAYGRVFEDCDGTIRIHPEVQEQVRALAWNAD
ncbi:MAG: hypothetical protein A3F78_22725 [Burkholderiales bacterium RIFCSPLOWO2_12_FULL_61_40]|nr:MAG: hypothetical protein A3F78_22725 [Burkholderiales bacterium RIFCSPLOWO2_12_FULL_61_40]